MSHRKEQAKSAGAAFPSKGFAKLHHSDFMKKVQKVLVEHAGNFSCMFDVLVGNGATRRIRGYCFPKREACLMATKSQTARSAVWVRLLARREHGQRADQPRPAAFQNKNLPYVLPLAPQL